VIVRCTHPDGSDAWFSEGFLGRHSLGGVAIRAALARAGIAPEQVQYVIMGQVLTAGAGQIPARQAAVAGGISMERAGA